MAGFSSAYTGGKKGGKKGGKTRKHSRTGRRVKKGGLGTTVNYGSAANYGIDTYGLGDVQYKNTFGPDPKYPMGNELVSLTGQKAGSRKQRKGRSRKGGFWGEVVKQAAVPFALLGLQQVYGKKTRKHRGGRGTTILARTFN